MSSDENRAMEEVFLRVFKKAGVIIVNDHFVYTSGQHGSAYFNKDALYPHALTTFRVCRHLAEQFADDNVETVIAPAMGGIILSQYVAFYLSGADQRFASPGVFSVYAEKIPGEPGEKEFFIGRGYDKFIADKRVLVVEDVLTTGASARKVVELTRIYGGHVIGLGVLCNRGKVSSQDVGNVPKLVALTDIELEAWDESNCPLCQQKVPINTKFGKGKEFVSRNK